MKKITILSLTMALALIGCGEGANDSNTKQNSDKLIEPNIVAPHKLDRANWKGISQLTNGLFVVDDNSDLSFKLEDNNIGSDKFRTQDIFVDLDNNKQTGYSNHSWGDIGAEILIEGDRLYKHTGNGWHWSFVRKIKRDTKNGTIEIDIPKESINIESEDIRVISGLLDRSWNLITKSEIVNYTVGGFVVNPIGNYSVKDSDKAVTFSINSSTVNGENFRIEDIFIDADNNANSGYTNPRWGSIGAEYLIEGDSLYQHTQSGWHWNYIGKVDLKKDADQLTISLNKNMVKLSSTIRSIAGLADRSWNIVERYDIDSLNLQNNGTVASMEDQVVEDVKSRHADTIKATDEISATILKRLDDRSFIASTYIKQGVDPDVGDMSYGDYVVTYNEEDNNGNLTFSTDIAYEAKTISLHTFGSDDFSLDPKDIKYINNHSKLLFNVYHEIHGHSWTEYYVNDLSTVKNSVYTINFKEKNDDNRLLNTPFTMAGQNKVENSDNIFIINEYDKKDQGIVNAITTYSKSTNQSWVSQEFPIETSYLVLGERGGIHLDGDHLIMPDSSLNHHEDYIFDISNPSDIKLLNP